MESHAGQDTSRNYHNTGARPKVYCPATQKPFKLQKDSTVYPRNPTELPDFVQDHLAIEQYYLNQEQKQQPISDVDNLPDFALNSVEQRQGRLRNESRKSESNASCDVPVGREPPRRIKLKPNVNSAHLNLPGFARSSVDSNEHPESSGSPLDLPISVSESHSGSTINPRDCPGTSEANIPKSLPDFLNDGPIHNRTTMSTECGSISNNIESIERRLLLENERLRNELELVQKESSQKTERIQCLASKLASPSREESARTIFLEKVVEQLKYKLERSTERAEIAESTVSSLKKEIKTLTTKLSLLQLENKGLKAEIAENEKECSSPNADQRVKRLASDLRNAASLAETSLTQLMSGVDNLRELASALENMGRIEARTENFPFDSDEDNAIGPAF